MDQVYCIMYSDELLAGTNRLSGGTLLRICDINYYHEFV